MNEIKESSPKQLKWLRDLLNSKDYGSFPADWRGWCDTIREQANLWVAAGHDAGTLNTALEIQGRIPVSHNDFQRILPKLQEAPPAKVAIPGLPGVMVDKPPAEIEDGVYKVGQTIFKVKRSKTGKQWAHKLVLEEPDCGGCANGEPCGGPGAGCPWTAKFIYAGTVARNGITPEHKLTYELAKEFGALYGVCCCCGRLLTNELSIYLGIGPVCGDREFGGEFKFLVNKAKLAVGGDE